MTPRQGGWGIAFALLLLIGGGMVSVPTADDPGAKIVAFYETHASIVIVAQVVGIIALVPLVLSSGRSQSGPRMR